VALPVLLAVTLFWPSVAYTAPAEPRPSDTPARASSRDAGPPLRVDLRPTLVERAPVIDGLLDDEPWRGAPIEMGEWLSYNPLYGDRIPQRTSVWIAYDAHYLYFAFRCEDPSPGGIKTSVTRRDNIWADDWVGLSLDALGTGQLAYHLMVNPSGVQADMLNSVAGGEDSSPDFVWDSAGRLDETGYTVEIRMPLQTLRFRGGHDVRMGILFWRRVSRIGVSVSWPPLAPGTWVFERHAALVFPELKPRLPREVMPAATYARNESRDTPEAWGAASDAADVGLGGKYGLTSTVTLDATVNPDFSQVESDAFQVEANQRFPIFFSEKRPFFMEGAGIFSLAGQGSDNSLQSVVHTRRIVDPVFGAKVTGTAGRVTFATLSAVDEAPGRRLDADDPDHGKDRVFNIARAQYSLGPSNYVGAIVTDTRFAGGDNRVAGADLSWRLNATQRLTGFVLGSSTRPSTGSPAARGLGAQVGYEYSTRRLVLVGAGEHYDPEFEMQTAFINRVGITSVGRMPNGASTPTRRDTPGSGGSRRSRSPRAGATASLAATTCSRSTVCGSA
jgi:hypothetical protein